MQVIGAVRLMESLRAEEKWGFCGTRRLPKTGLINISQICFSPALLVHTALSQTER